MSEQNKMDAERAAFVRELEQLGLSAELDAHGVFKDQFVMHLWSGFELRSNASLPVGVPDESMVEMAAAAYDRAANAGATHEQAWHDALSVALYAPAAPTVKAEQVDMADAYVGAREDLSIWKRRALEAEQKLRHQEQIIDHLTLEAQGETRFGEPSIPSAEPVAVIEYAGYDPANSIKWLNKGLQYMEPGTLLYAQAPSLPASGSAVEEVEVLKSHLSEAVELLAEAKALIPDFGGRARMDAWRKRFPEFIKRIGYEEKPSDAKKDGTFCRICGTKLCVKGVCTIYCPNRECGVPGRGTKALTKPQLECLEAGLPVFDAALSAQQSAPERVSVPVPFVRFLLGESEIDGAAFGERHPSMPGQFWWRKQLRAILSHGRGEA